MPGSCHACSPPKRVASSHRLSATTPSYLPHLLLCCLALWTVAQLILPRSVPATSNTRRTFTSPLVPASTLRAANTEGRATPSATDRPNSSSSSVYPSNPRVSCNNTATAAGQQRITPLELPMANDQPPVLVRPIALLFGDSLTERAFDSEGGWGAALAHHYARKLDVVNRGFGGYNSRWGLKLLEQVLQQIKAQGQQVALMTIWFGANDAAMPGRSAERQHVPVQEYASNLEQMVKAAQAAGIPRIILLTSPPVGDEARVKHQQKRMGITDAVPPDRTLDFAQQYATAVQNVANKLQIPYVDLYHKLQQTDGWREQYLDDGLHFTPAGARKVWSELKHVMQQSYPELSLDKLSNQMPWWDQWDHQDPEAYWQKTLPELQAKTASARMAVDDKNAKN